MSSFRFGDLEPAAKRAAQVEQVSYSDFVRAAVAERTERVLAGVDNVALLGDVVGCIDDPTVSSQDTGKQVRALLEDREDHQQRAAG